MIAIHRLPFPALFLPTTYPQYYCSYSSSRPERIVSTPLFATAAPLIQSYQYRLPENATSKRKLLKRTVVVLISVGIGGYCNALHVLESRQGVSWLVPAVG
jgi:hypothetical protein